MANAPTNIGAFIARIGEGITVRAQQQEQDAVIRAKLSTPERALTIEMPCGTFSFHVPQCRLHLPFRPTKPARRKASTSGRVPLFRGVCTRKHTYTPTLQG